MKVSVVIPFYNNYVSILKTLDSLIEQSETVFEVFLIDDYSDNEQEVIRIVQQYQLKLPIQLLRNEQNRNGAYSRNRGILAAKGAMIAFLDADDTWAPNKVQRMVEVAKEYGLESLYFSKVKIKLNDEIITTRPSHFNTKAHISEYLFLEDGFIQTSSIFCSSAIAKGILFQEQFKRHQDYDFVLRAADKGINFHFISEELVTYTSDTGVNLSKGEAYSYSKLWADEMKPYFSNAGLQGFIMFNLTARLCAEKRYIKAIVNFLKGALSLNIVNYFRISSKFIRSIKVLLKLKG